MLPYIHPAFMKHSKKIAIVLLNVLFSAVVLWFFARNLILHPFSGGFVKEAISGILLLGSLYFNYFVLYPKLYPKYPQVYWAVVVLSAIVVGVVETALAYRFIVSRHANAIKLVGYFEFFATHQFEVIGRNLALNFFPFLFRDRKHYQHSLEDETKIVYERVRMLDVADKDSNIQLLTMDDIFYCEQQRNFTTIHTVQNEKYTRLGSMKHLEQLLGEEEFVRITTTLLVPFQYIQSCKDNMVVMKQMPWQRVPTTFPLEARMQAEAAEKILAGILRYGSAASENDTQGTSVHSATRRKPALPSEEKVREVLSYIEAHPNCNTADIMAETDFSLSTVERCLAELKKRGAIQYTGSKKSGGYSRV